MHATVVALVIAASAWLPHFWFRVPPAFDPSVGTAEVVPEPGLLPIADCPECVCLPEPERVPEDCSQAADSTVSFRTGAAGVFGAAVGAVAGHYRHGLAHREGPEAGAEIGDPIPW